MQPTRQRVTHIKILQNSHPDQSIFFDKVGDKELQYVIILVIYLIVNKLSIEVNYKMISNESGFLNGVIIHSDIDYEYMSTHTQFLKYVTLINKCKISSMITHCHNSVSTNSFYLNTN